MDMRPRQAHGQRKATTLEATASALVHDGRRAREQTYRLALAEALRVQAMVAIRQAHWDEATTALEEGLELVQRIGYPYAEGRLLRVYAEMHSRKGEPALARTRLETALAIFRRLGALKDIERAGQAIAELPSD